MRERAPAERSKGTFMTELQVLSDRDLRRAIWEDLRKEGITQKELTQLIPLLDEALPDYELGKVSGSYISQLIGKPRDSTKKVEKQPTTSVVRAIALALAMATQRHRAAISHERLQRVDTHIAELLPRLHVGLPVWQAGEAPLEPNVINAVARPNYRTIEVELMSPTYGASIGIVGPPKVGKSTALRHAVSLARFNGYRVLFADIGQIFRSSRNDEARFWSMLCRQFGIGDAVTDDLGMLDAVELWLAEDPSPGLVALDGANVLYEEPSIDWAEPAVAVFLRHLVQSQRGAAPSSPINRYGVIAALTFDPAVIADPSYNSLRIAADHIIQLRSFDDSEVTELIRRRARYKSMVFGPGDDDSGTTTPGKPVNATDGVASTKIATAVNHYFAGNPLLVQDFVARWDGESSGQEPTALLEAPSSIRSRFIANLAKQVRDPNQMLQMEITNASGGDPVVIECDPGRMHLLGLVDERRHWTAPYLEVELAPLLAVATGGDA